jgi:flagellar protein FliO/FliZ
MIKRQLLVLCGGLFNALAAYSEEGGAGVRQAAKALSYVDVLQWILALIIVLMVFGLFIWLLRKTGNLSFVGKSQLVRVGEKQLLLGVTPGRVDKLLELEGESRLFQNQLDEGQNSLFAKKFQQVLQGKVDV